MMSKALNRPVSSQFDLDTDGISPDSIKAALDFAMGRMAAFAEGRGDSIDWNSFEFALHDNGDATTKVVTRASVL